MGRFDGFWETGLHPWDMAAGRLLVEEAGGRVTRFDGTKVTLGPDQIVATNGAIHEELLAARMCGRVPEKEREERGCRAGSARRAWRDAYPRRTWPAEAPAS